MYERESVCFKGKEREAHCFTDKYSKENESAREPDTVRDREKG